MKRQVTTIRVDGGYRPAIVRARAGVPIRLIFERDDDDECLDRVIFSRPRLERRLARSGQTTVDLPAQPAGRTQFTCGMGRYRGYIESQESPSGFAATLVWEVRRRSSALTVAGFLWICTLPLVAALAALLIDGRAAVVAAATTLLVLVAACLTASRDTGQA